jgi:Flp pilus assembly protein TadG
MPHSGHTPATSLRTELRVAARGSSRGQAFVFLLPVLAALAAAFLLVFDSGQAVSEKQRLVNAADAAALGAATWQARALNFESYMNRAVIANEAAIAQSVSLRSWSAYMNRLLPGASMARRSRCSASGPGSTRSCSPGSRRSRAC